MNTLLSDFGSESSPSGSQILLYGSGSYYTDQDPSIRIRILLYGSGSYYTDQDPTIRIRTLLYGSGSCYTDQDSPLYCVSTLSRMEEEDDHLLSLGPAHHTRWLQVDF